MGKPIWFLQNLKKQVRNLNTRRLFFANFDMFMRK